MSLNPLCCYKATSHQPNTTIFFLNSVRLLIYWFMSSPMARDVITGLCVISGFLRCVNDIWAFFFLDFTRCRLIISYRRFGTIYHSHLRGSFLIWAVWFNTPLLFWCQYWRNVEGSAILSDICTDMFHLRKKLMFPWPCLLANDQLDAQIFNKFITILYMFWAISCSSWGGQILLTL